MVVEGVEQVQENIVATMAQIVEAVGVAAFDVAGEVVMPLAIDRTPEDTGALKQSAYVGEPVTEEERVSVEMGYTDPIAPIVHQRKTREIAGLTKSGRHRRRRIQHQTGEPRFLATALQDSASSVVDAMASGVRELLGGVE